MILLLRENNVIIKCEELRYFYSVLFQFRTFYYKPLNRVDFSNTAMILAISSYVRKYYDFSTPMKTVEYSYFPINFRRI